MPRPSGSDPYERKVFYARHLEVFVPKPRNGGQEEELTKCLNGLIHSDGIPNMKLEPAQFDEITQEHQQLLRKARWENILYGYSTYFTDGTFVQLQPEDRRRSQSIIWREQTLVFKFIVTNYATAALNAFWKPGLVSLMDVSLRDDLPAQRVSELTMASLHYRATCAHVVNMFSTKVLGPDHRSEGEMEVWSQEWPTMLERRKQSARTDPIMLDIDSDRRWANSNEQATTILVREYASV